jgi:hypothetical protein
MVWSLSKDDDGLEPVGSDPDAARRSLPVSPAPAGPPPSRAALAPRPLLVDSGSVVVDPLSQIPEPVKARASAPVRRRVAEPTLVLGGRQLDQLRAEVRGQQLGAAQRSQRTLLYWGLAGAGALMLGAVGASVLGGGASELSDTAVESAEAPLEASAAVRAGVPLAAPEESSTPPAEGAAERAPSGAASAEAARAAPQPSAPARTRRGRAEPPPRVVSLDDLPVE